MSSDAAETKQPDSEQDYRTLLLQHTFRRIPVDKRTDCLKEFFQVFSPDSVVDLPSNSDPVSEDMFVRRLNQLVVTANLNTSQLHRKLATATYRVLQSTRVSLLSTTSTSTVPVTEQKDNPSSSSSLQGYRLFGAGDEKYASALRFDLSPTAIQSLAAEIETEINAVMDAIAGLPEDARTTNTVLLPLVQLEQRLSALENSVCLLQNVSPDKAVRDASHAAEVQLRKHAVEVSMRKDVYRVIKSYAEAHCDADALDAEWRRYLEFTLRDYRRAGLDLEDAKYEEIKAIKKRMSEIASEFAKNLNEENTVFILEEDELKGMPADWMSARLIRDGDGDDDEATTAAAVGKYRVSLKYPDLFPILQKCLIEKTREKMLRAHNSRCMKENTPIMEELVKLRYQQAQLLGKANHASHVLEIRMAKNPKMVWDFLHDLNAKMQPLADKDLQALLALKKQEKEAAQQAFDGVIHEHDFRYYCTLREEKEFAIDKESLRVYFPIQTVIDGALQIYQTLLGLKFLPVPSDESQFLLWHSDVQLYQVQDTRTQELFGYFFLDLFPREGKYGHACKMTLQTGCNIYGDDGSVVGTQLPINTLLCNFPKPTDDKPSLLSHDDVVTFFHEFGHCVHQLIGRTALSRFAGTAVERDFVEAPSQMLENWCWKAKSLNLMSGHFEDNNKKIPVDVVDALSKSKNANCGLLTKRQLYFGILDQTMHTVEDDKGIDTQQLCYELQPKILGIEAQKDTNFVASFGHLAGGYDAQYYGYMWSEVYSADMFHSVFCANGDDSLLDVQNGLNYRNKILAVGGSRDAMDSLKEFLGREPNNIAFLKEKGL